jgi:hypothetical protein
VIAAADDEMLDRLERLIVIHQVALERDPGEQDRRAEAAVQRHWPGWK